MPSILLCQTIFSNSNSGVIYYAKYFLFSLMIIFSLVTVILSRPCYNKQYNSK